MRKNNLNQIRPRHILILLVLSVVVWFVAYMFPQLLEPGERQLLRFHMQNVPSIGKEKIIYVVSGDYSMEKIGTWPFPRDIYAKTIENVGSARTIALDFAFFEKSNDENDRQLAQAIEKHTNVVMLNYINEEEKVSASPFELFERHAAQVGYVNNTPDSDGVFRKYTLFFEETVDDRPALYPSFAYSILAAHGYSMTLDQPSNTLMVYDNNNAVRRKIIKLDSDYRFWIRDFPPENGDVYELSDVYEGKIPPSTFDDAIVIIGMTAHGVAKPMWTISGTTSEVFVMGDAVQSLLSGFNPPEISHFNDAFLNAFFFLLCAIITLALPIHKGLSFLLTVLMGTLVFILSFLLFTGNIVYIHSFDYIVWMYVAYFVAITISFMDLSKNVSATVIPITYLFKLSDSKNMELPQYLAALGQVMEKTTGVKIIEPIITKKDASSLTLVGSVFDDTPDHGVLIIPGEKHKSVSSRALVSHIYFDGDQERYFTLLEVKNPVSNPIINSVASLIIASSLYFKAVQKSAEQEELFYNLIQCMTEAIDAKDPITAGHSRRVADLSVMLGQHMGMTGKELDELKLAGIIHDIGKIGIDDSVLNKPGIFTTKEYTLMKEHPAKGIAIMKPAQLSENIVDGILNHHERIDGKGYPRGLAGDEFGLFAKIIKIADVYDALVSNRQYKKAWSVEKACTILHQGKGSEFDPFLTDLFLENYAPKDWHSPLATDTVNVKDDSALINLVTYAYKLSVKMDIYLDNQVGSLAMYTAHLELDNLECFFGLEWGEHYATLDFMLQHPCLIAYTSLDNSYYYALACAQNPVSQIIYYFSEKYLAGGIITIDKGRPEDFILLYGTPTMETNEVLCWDKGKLYVVLFKEEISCATTTMKMVYLTKYAYQEKQNG